MKSKEELKALWTKFNDREVADIIVPPEEEEDIIIPELHETELGVKAKKLSDSALTAGKNLSMDDLKTAIEYYLKLCSEKSVEVELQTEV